MNKGVVFVQNFTDSDSIVRVRRIQQRLKDATLIKSLAP